MYLIYTCSIIFVIISSINQVDLDNKRLGDDIPILDKEITKINEQIRISRDEVRSKAISDNEIIPQTIPSQQKLKITTRLEDNKKLINASLHKSDMHIITMLLAGKSEELLHDSHTSKQLYKMYWMIENIDLSLKQKHVLWKIIKSNRSTKELKLIDLKVVGKIISSISEYDLVNLNISDWDIVSYLGKIKTFSHRQVSLLAHALMITWGKNILKSNDYIKKIFGIICGFQYDQIETIPLETFLQIQSPGFNYLYACNNRQLEILLKQAMKPGAYGPIQTWTANNLDNLGMIIKALNDSQIKSIRPLAMKGINNATIQELSTSQLKAISNEQFKNLNYPSQTSYRIRVGLISSSNSNFNLIIPLIIFLLLKLL